MFLLPVDSRNYHNSDCSVNSAGDRDGKKPSDSPLALPSTIIEPESSSKAENHILQLFTLRLGQSSGKLTLILISKHWVWAWNVFVIRVALAWAEFGEGVITRTQVNSFLEIFLKKVADKIWVKTCSMVIELKIIYWLNHGVGICWGQRRFC